MEIRKNSHGTFEALWSDEFGTRVAYADREGEIAIQYSSIRTPLTEKQIYADQEAVRKELAKQKPVVASINSNTGKQVTWYDPDSTVVIAETDESSDCGIVVRYNFMEPRTKEQIIDDFIKAGELLCPLDPQRQHNASH